MAAQNSLSALSSFINATSAVKEVRFINNLARQTAMFTIYL
jgi:hypothetical protein